MGQLYDKRPLSAYSTGGKHKARGPNLGLHLVSTQQQHQLLLNCEEAVTFIPSSNYIRPFEGKREADVAPSENEFDTIVLDTLEPADTVLAS